MHDHSSMTKQRYRVTLMSIDAVVHQIDVDTPCTCDLWDWITTLDLPIIPAFMDVRRIAKVPAAAAE